MLRRTESVARKIDLPEADEVEAGIESAASSRSTDRRQTDRREGDRRQAERRGMEALRAEALQAVISKVEDRNFGGLRNSFDWRPKLGIPKSRLLLLAVALVAGGLAAWLATRHDEVTLPAVAAASAPAENAAPPTAHVLVAKAAIAAGARLSADALEWLDWPEANLRDDFITETATPDALTKYVGNAARVAILPGEPIRAARLADADGSFLAAILGKDMRGVSVSVNAEAASGGFVAPNDHVDVVLNRTIGTQQVSQTILTDVTVLAINGRVGRTSAAASAPPDEGQQSETFANQAIATVALDPRQAEVIIAATAMGKLSLVLRPAGTPPTDAAATAESAANAAIKLTSPFWSTGPTMQ